MTHGSRLYAATASAATALTTERAAQMADTTCGPSCMIECVHTRIDIEYKYKYKWGFVERGLQIVQGR